VLCHAPDALPSARGQALGKDWPLPSATSHTRQRPSLSSVFLALGKESFLTSVFLTLDKDLLCRVPKKHSIKKISNQILKP